MAGQRFCKTPAGFYGWEIVRRTYDDDPVTEHDKVQAVLGDYSPPGDEEEIIGQVDTEGMADAVLSYLTKSKGPFEEGVWY